jgi:V/A-type H+-transporting ATPase subunit G/H
VLTLPLDDESFAAGRQALLDALQGLERRAQDRAERTLRDAEQRARQLIIESEARAQQVTRDAESRADRLVTEAEQRARQVTLEAAQRVAELEQQLSEVRDNVELARTQLEEQFVAIHGMVEVARANLATARERASSAPRRTPEPRGQARVSIPPLSSQVRAASGDLATAAAPSSQPSPEEAALSASLNDLRTTVEGLKRPRRGERVSEPPPEPEPEVESDGQPR